ncbi:HAD family hydrolase [Longimicrobium sp.]|uniref:HAD family hydrolase n=1 Tax=Longimicrobium sp. TaxID=2029185 RepID=UPI003B3AE052
MIVFDADDTLWRTQELYDEAKARFFAWLAELGHDPGAAVSAYTEIDLANVARLGFSRERFPSSMEATYRALCSSRSREPDPAGVVQARTFATWVFDSTPELRPDAEAALERLEGSFRLILFTAGDPDVQWARIQGSGLSGRFDHVHVVAQKTVGTWRALLEEVSAVPERTWSVGNSVRSDINPALELGLRCVLIAARSWAYEQASLPPEGSYSPSAGVWRAETLTDAADIILSLTHGPARADGIRLEDPSRR